MVELNTISDILKENNIKPSIQRMKIYSYLINQKTHPTVEEIYLVLSKELPTLSKTTVYNTLNVFIENGITQRLTIDENETRYDADVSDHGHFKCTNCGKVLDFRFEKLNYEANQLKDYEIKECHVYFKGKCNECKK